MPYNVEYFNKHVREEIEAWPVETLAHYARLVALLMDYGPDLRMPHSRAMGGGLFELRPRSKAGAGRALYCFCDGRRVTILHAFLKSSQATPKRDLDTAIRRMKEVRDAQG